MLLKPTAGSAESALRVAPIGGPPRAQPAGVIGDRTRSGAGATGPAAPAFVAAWCAFVVLTALSLKAAVSVPMYAAREGRACDNCHLTPNEWVNPDLAQRKCGLSCQTCHVDPAGGGMRNASGRFYGRATLPMIATSPRPTSDWDRGVPGLGRRDRATTYSDRLPAGPSTFDRAEAYHDSVRDPWAWGRPLGPPTRYGPFQGRHHTLNADPLFRIGGDARIAALFSQATLVFPMQLDIPAAFHPVHHVTLLINTGVRGRPSGYSDTIDDEHTPYFREAFLLLHEAPYQLYVKTGRFVPSYGLRLDDHTSRIRRELELDGALPESRVTGVEIGAAPNYPFINLSWFKMTSKLRVPDAWDLFDTDDGSGAALNAGFRELGWAVGGSAMVRRRPLDEGGDTDAAGVYGVLNPWVYVRGVPVTLQGELDYGRFQRASGLESSKLVGYGEIDWLLWNGVNVLFAYDWADPDREVADDHSHRFQTGIQSIVIPGVTLDARVRVLVPATDGGTDADLFVQLHVWN